MKITPETIEWLKDTQRRCVECGNTYHLEIHHRIFRSETETGLLKHLGKACMDYKKSYGKILLIWEMDSIQNLVILCRNCHSGQIHNGNDIMRNKYRNSFTCPYTGVNVKFKRVKTLY